MVCPVCKSKDARRSRRQYAVDYFYSTLGVYPWRCRKCEKRFHSRLMTFNELVHAHCPICGNPVLKRISGEHVNSTFAFLWRLLAVPAYRCEPCRHKYFSIRPYREGQNQLPQSAPAD